MGRGWTAAGVVISRCGTGEGLLPKNPNTRFVLKVIKAGNSDSTSWLGSAKFNFGIRVYCYWARRSGRPRSQELRMITVLVVKP
ncbi:hypothetical protein SBA2_10018 [Acidobacteriia bacterium SbA2]|nr:hypothetical protein SBA2_10018 [Acidobacteriia bacterium SbA2]